MKKRLTQAQEFDIMKLVLDKFLWVATIIVGFGFWKLYSTEFAEGIYLLVAGAIMFILFMVMIMRQYEFQR